MAIEWGPATKAAAERQAEAIRKIATTPEQKDLADRCEKGEFTDYSDDHICPMMALYTLCQKAGLSEIADRVKNGEFDADMQESNEWAASDSGKDAFQFMLQGNK